MRYIDSIFNVNKLKFIVFFMNRQLNVISGVQFPPILNNQQRTCRWRTGEKFPNLMVHVQLQKI